RENLQENLESSEALSSATISGSDSDHLKIDLYVKGDTFNRNSNSEKSNMEFIDKEKRVFNKEIDIKKNNMKTSRCPKENKISETGYKIPINGNGNGKHKKTSIPPCLRTIISTVVKHDFSNANLNINAENVGINEIIYGVDSNDEFLALTRKIYEENLQDMEMIKETFMNDRGIEIGLVYNSSKGYLFKCSYEEMFKNSSNSKGLTEKIRQKKNKPSVSYFNEPANGFINKSMNVSSAEIILNENKKQNYPFSALTELTNSKEEGNRLLRNKNDGYFSIQEECGSSEENSRDNYFYHGNRGLNKKYNDAYDLNMSNVDCNELNCVDYSSISGDLDDQKCRNGNFLGESLQDNFHVNSPIKNTSTSVFDDLDPIILFKRKEQIFFTTIEAQKINSRITACIDEIIKICGMICIETEKRFAKHRSDFLEISETIAELDMINSFFLFATKNKCRIPSFGDTIAISNTSHLFLQKNAVRNSVYADEQLNIQFVTGGNMCGKTTYVKQIGLLTVLGQIGSPINGNGSLRIFKKMVTRLVRSSNENEFEETGYFWKLIDSNGAKAKNYSKNGNDDPGKDFKDNEFNYKADENSNNECNEYLKDDSKNKPSDTLIIVDEIGRSLFYKEGLCFLLAFTKMLIKRNIFAYIVTHYTEVLNYLEDDEVNVIKAENYCISGGLGVSDCAIELCREYFPPRIIEGSVYLKRKYLDLENIRGLKFDNSYVRVAKRLKKDENIDIKKYLKKDLQ
ncbi:MutS like protein 4, partial [Dictyocoela roeselum]